MESSEIRVLWMIRLALKPMAEITVTKEGVAGCVLGFYWKKQTM
ncbi:hypothetical protein [Methanospirillum sp.]|nr:hypothetical protein [Methanospirillum sp.]